MRLPRCTLFLLLTLTLALGGCPSANDDDATGDDDDATADDDDATGDDDDATADDDDATGDDDDSAGDDDDSTPPPVDGDGDGVPEGTDCDDADPANFPGNVEVCDDADNDCDPATFAADEDTDGDSDGVITCLDCDDADPANFPGNVEVCDDADNDCDPATFAADEDTDGDSDGVITCLDCDDADPDVFPGANEVCNSGLDDDCDPTTDETVDIDGDGVSACGGDCDELDPAVLPGATEVCNGVDDDCDPSTEFLGYVGIDQTTSGTLTSSSFYGTVWLIERASSLAGLSQSLERPAGATLEWRVYSAPADTGPWTLEAQAASTVPAALGGVQAWHQSPPMSVSLQAGTYYYVGVWQSGGLRYGTSGVPELRANPIGQPIRGMRVVGPPPGASITTQNLLHLYATRLLVDVESDVDGDGSVPCLDDCHDGDAAVGSGQTEIACDWIDQDCDPGTPDCPDLVITEIMHSPLWDDSEDSYEWIEVTNTGSAPLDLQSLRIVADGTDDVLISDPVVVPAGGVAVLGDDPDSTNNGGVTLDWSWDDDIDLNTGKYASSLALHGVRGALIEEVPYGDPGFPDPLANSLSLDPSALDPLANDVASAWCWSCAGPYGTGPDVGSPGVANAACPQYVSGAAPGDIIVTEVMWDPASYASWFELSNTTGAAIDLQGWSVSAPPSSTQGTWVVTSSIVVPPGGFALVAGYPSYSASAGLPTADAYAYWTIEYEDSDSLLEVTSPEGVVIDTVDWDSTAGWPGGAGASMTLRASAFDDLSNDDPTSWCAGTSAFGSSGDLGTPGAANDPCP